MPKNSSYNGRAYKRKRVTWAEEGRFFELCGSLSTLPKVHKRKRSTESCGSCKFKIEHIGLPLSHIARGVPTQMMCGGLSKLRFDDKCCELIALNRMYSCCCSLDTRAGGVRQSGDRPYNPGTIKTLIVIVDRCLKEQQYRPLQRTKAVNIDGTPAAMFRRQHPFGVYWRANLPVYTHTYTHAYIHICRINLENKRLF